MQVGDELDKMSKRLGNLRRDVLSELKFAAEQSGASLDACHREGLYEEAAQHAVLDANNGVKASSDGLPRPWGSTLRCSRTSVAGASSSLAVFEAPGQGGERIDAGGPGAGRLRACGHDAAARPWWPRARRAWQDFAEAAGQRDAGQNTYTHWEAAAKAAGFLPTRYNELKQSRGRPGQGDPPQEWRSAATLTDLVTLVHTEPSRRLRRSGCTGRSREKVLRPFAESFEGSGAVKPFMTLISGILVLFPCSRAGSSCPTSPC